MRSLMVHLVTEVEFEDGDEASDKTVQNYRKQLLETVRNAAQGLLLRTVKGARIESVSGRRNQNRALTIHRRSAKCESTRTRSRIFASLPSRSSANLAAATAAQGSWNSTATPSCRSF